MVQTYQYLKDVYTMSAEEKQQLAKRVAMMEDPAQETSMDFDLITLSALSRSHGFISVAHQLDSDRVWTEMRGFLKLLKPLLPEIKEEDSVQQTQESVQIKADSVKNSQKSVQSAIKPASSDKGKEQTLGTLKAAKGDRPQHFDAWYDLMSDGLKQKVEQLKDLHTKKVYYRQMVEQLAQDESHSKQDMSLAATLAVSYEKKILAIYNMADIEWEELSGRGVAPEVKTLAKQGYDEAERNIRKAEKGEKVEKMEKAEKVEKVEKVEKKTADMSDDELEAMTIAEILASDLPDGPRQYYINKRIEMARGYLKKMIPESMSEEQKQKAAGYMKELSDAGKNLSPKAKENAKAAGILDD